MLLYLCKLENRVVYMPFLQGNIKADYLLLIICFLNASLSSILCPISIFIWLYECFSVFPL
nr:MAG TPA: hypothetical protein [Siphoviridae sp. ctqtA1]